ncbi:hypothetical protein DRO26_00120 [Candidatus Bathyarchaeota archaeon]|nr:MAG: hypothetical protein DRO26_00120 [Candidatus Bathyarchaeota archaeon]
MINPPTIFFVFQPLSKLSMEDMNLIRKPSAPITATPNRHTRSKSQNSVFPGLLADLSVL